MLILCPVCGPVIALRCVVNAFDAGKVVFAEHGLEPGVCGQTASQAPGMLPAL